MLMRLIGCVASATLASVAVALPAAAEGGGECTAYNSRGQCLFRATSDDSTNAREAKDERQTVRVSSCMWNGSPVPCSTSDGWYDAATGCYLSLDSDRPLLGPDPSKTDPTIQRYRCTLIVAIVDQRPAVEVMIQPVFRRKGRATPVVDPREVAREVVAEMTMRAIKIGMVPRPGRTGYVNLPVWMWVADPGPETTGPLTVTKAEQGLSITATATLDRIVWDMGDGSTVTCGAGTPYVETEQVEDSPDCGYRYQATSKHVPGGRYTVTATSYWNVHWTGGGTEGDINGLDFGQSVRVPIGELRPVIVAPGN